MFATWGMPIFLVGLFLKRKSPDERVFDAWLGAILLYFVVVGHGNSVHEYYQLPLVLPACVYMGKVYGRYFRVETGKLPLAVTGLAALLAMMLWSAYTVYDVYYMARENPANSPLYALGLAAQRTTPADSRFVAIDGGDPTLLYLMDRKGWHAFPSDLNERYLNDCAREGALYVAGLKSSFEEDETQRLKWLPPGSTVVVQTNDYFIARLEPQMTPTAGPARTHAVKPATVGASGDRRAP
jgi:hypothetical protein